MVEYPSDEDDSLEVEATSQRNIRDREKHNGTLALAINSQLTLKRPRDIL